MRLFLFLIMIAGSSVGCGKRDPHGAADWPRTTQPPRINEARARELFEQEVMRPLRDWRFVPDAARYYIAQQLPGTKRMSFPAIRQYRIADLAGSVTKTQSTGVPYVARITFTSAYEIESMSGNLAVAPHAHIHTYQLVNGHWRLETQSYTIGIVAYDCLVGHLQAQSSRAEALCVDESVRMVGSE